MGASLGGRSRACLWTSHDAAGNADAALACTARCVRAKPTFGRRLASLTCGTTTNSPHTSAKTTKTSTEARLRRKATGDHIPRPDPHRPKMPPLLLMLEHQGPQPCYATTNHGQRQKSNRNNRGDNNGREQDDPSRIGWPASPELLALARLRRQLRTIRLPYEQLTGPFDRWRDSALEIVSPIASPESGHAWHSRALVRRACPYRCPLISTEYGDLQGRSNPGGPMAKVSEVRPTRRGRGRRRSWRGRRRSASRRDKAPG